MIMSSAQKSSICLFSSYFSGNKIPYYIKYYLQELKKYCNDLIFITNQKSLLPTEIDFLCNVNVELLLVENEGYDFGMWFKAMNQYDVTNYEQIILANDSCVLFKSLAETFKWIDSTDADYCGLVSSKRVRFHLQSFFLVINKRAIEPVRTYFRNHNIINDYQKVIEVYEIGLCSHLSSLGLKIKSRFQSNQELEIHNPSFYELDRLLKEGMPMIKKKIIFRSYRYGEYLSLFRMNFNIDQDYYINLIKTYNHDSMLIDFSLVVKDASKKNRFDIFLYNTVKNIYRLLSTSKMLTATFHQLILIRRRLRGNKDIHILKTSITDKQKSHEQH